MRLYRHLHKCMDHYFDVDGSQTVITRWEVDEIDNAEWVEKVVAGLPYAGLSVKQGLDGSGFRNLEPANAFGKFD